MENREKYDNSLQKPTPVEEQEFEPVDNLLVEDYTEVDKSTGNKRGWVLDALVKVGQIEAALNHNDEQISYLKDQLTKVSDPDEVAKIVDEISVNEELMKIDYANRKESMDELFNTFGGDRHYYCQVKHRAAAFVIASEIFHSRGMNADDELSMHRAAEALALTCSLAFGFKPFSCLRCMDTATQEKDEYDSIVE